jgi:NAD(P)-dependent dehydrogenase (short-subunit alcohol dehydrogenase family)
MTIALITGANRGLGLATARRIAATGATALVGSRDARRGATAVAELRAGGLDAELAVLDVDDVDSVHAAMARIGEAHGHVDVLVNNAGILPEATAEADGPLDTCLLRRTFETNVIGAARMIEHAMPLLLRAPAGRIVNVSSQMGSLADQADPGSPYYGVVLPGYQASKAALNALTIAVGKKLAGTSVTITSVCPGWVRTDLGGPANRAAAPLEADEAARIVAAVALGPTDELAGAFVGAAGRLPW